MPQFSPDQFPRLSTFLNLYMNKNWKAHGDTIGDVLASFVSDHGNHDLERLCEDIEDMIGNAEIDASTAFYESFPNAADPKEWNMTVDEWLCVIMDQGDDILDSQDENI